MGKEEIFKPIIDNESLHNVSNDNDVRVVNFGTSKYDFQEHNISALQHS
jgi:hypothetical protein